MCGRGRELLFEEYAPPSRLALSRLDVGRFEGMDGGVDHVLRQCRAIRDVGDVDDIRCLSRLGAELSQDLVDRALARPNYPPRFLGLGLVRDREADASNGNWSAVCRGSAPARALHEDGVRKESEMERVGERITLDVHVLEEACPEFLEVGIEPEPEGVHDVANERTAAK